MNGKMKQMIVTRHGGPEVLQFIDSDVPEPTPDQVRLKVLVTGIAWADTLARRRLYPGAPKVPFALGYDVVGVIDRIGQAVNDFSVGQRVGALLIGFGGNADYVCVAAAMLVPVPAALDSAQAVSIILNGLTAYDALHRVAKIKSGESILVTSAAGGVGSYMVQLARLAGLTVYGTASAQKLDTVKRLGATPINYREENVGERVQALTGGGAQVVMDLTGDVGPVLASLGKGGGRLALALKDKTRLAMLASMVSGGVRRMTASGKSAAFYGDLPSQVKRNRQWYRATLSQLFDLLAAGQVQALIGAQLPLSEAARGHTLIEAGAVSGKIVLECGS
jgi:NADPH:quinone reductase-like Zn-dependent oxidoreductase